MTNKNTTGSKKKIALTFAQYVGEDYSHLIAAYENHIAPAVADTIENRQEAK